MKTDTPFFVTEWDWFMLKLDHCAIWDRTSSLWERYSGDSPGKLICSLFFITEEKDRNLPQDKRLFYFWTWVNSSKFQIAQILQNIPVLKNELNIETDVEFRISEYNNKEMSSTLVCTIIGDVVDWAHHGKPS
jgi:hypothetical protein